MGFERMYITNDGATLSAKTLQGKSIEFDHVEIGDGTLSGQEINQKNLVNKVLDCTINNIKIVNDTQVRVSFLFSNQNLEEPIYFRELGLIAIDPDTEEEVLYAYANAGDNAEYITNSETNMIEKYININATIGNAEEVTINIDPTQTYVTQDVLDTALDNKVDKVQGKGLSTNDYTTEEKTKLAGLSNYDDTTINNKITAIQVKTFTIPTSSWTQNATTELYEATISDTSVNSYDNADISFDLATYDVAVDAGIKGYVTEIQGTGIKLYADSVPESAVSGKYVVNRGVGNG